MRISFICAIYGLDKLPEFRRMITSVENQYLDFYEIIVVDQNECNTMKSVISEFSNANIIYEKSAKGLSKARNAGLKHAKYEWVCFPDDDCFYPNNFFKGIKTKTELWNFIVVNVRDIDEVTTTNFTRRTYSGTLKKEEIFYNACSISMLVRNNSKICFDENFGLGAEFHSCEDYDYCLNYFLTGEHIYFDYDAFVCHPRNDVLKEDVLIRKIKNNSKGHGAYFAKWFHVLRKQAFLELSIHLLASTRFFYSKSKRSLYLISFKSRLRGFYGYFKKINTVSRF